MPIGAKQLGNGQLANAAAVLYTAPADTVAFIKTLTLHNTDSAVRTCTIWFKEAVTGNTRIVVYTELGVRFTYNHPVAIVLNTGDALWGDDDSASSDKVDWTLFGAEET